MAPPGGPPAGGPPGGCRGDRSGEGWWEFQGLWGGGLMLSAAPVGGAVGVADGLSFVGRGILQMGHLLLTLKSKVRQLRHR